MIVPGFNHRFPKEGDDDYLWSYADCHTEQDTTRHSRRHPRLRPGVDRESFHIESCCTTLDEALAAQSRGADRIELCTDLPVGGITPSKALIRSVVQSLTIPVNVLIRPAHRHSRRHPRLRPGVDRESQPVDGFSSNDFVYDESDLDQMVADIEYCKTVGAAGIVVGALTPDGGIDVPSMRRLIAAAAPLPVTFHRAFDVAAGDPIDDLETIISLGCARLLTSGRSATAWDGRDLLSQLVRRAAGRLIVMPGRGVTPANLPALAATTLATEFHGTAIP